MIAMISPLISKLATAYLISNQRACHRACNCCSSEQKHPVDQSKST